VPLGAERASAAPVTRHQIRLFRRENLVDLGDRAVGELLHVGLRVTLVVLGDGMILEELLQSARWHRAVCSHRDARVLGLVAHDLDEIAPPLFGERRHRHPDQVAGGRRIEPRSESRIAFSITCTIFFSHGCT
jgi:hypothetical protein